MADLSSIPRKRTPPPGSVRSYQLCQVDSVRAGARRRMVLRGRSDRPILFGLRLLPTGASASRRALLAIVTSSRDLGSKNYLAAVGRMVAAPRAWFAPGASQTRVLS